MTVYVVLCLDPRQPMEAFPIAVCRHYMEAERLAQRMMAKHPMVEHAGLLVPVRYRILEAPWLDVSADIEEALANAVPRRGIDLSGQKV